MTSGAGCTRTVAATGQSHRSRSRRAARPRPSPPATHRQARGLSGVGCVPILPGGSLGHLDQVRDERDRVLVLDSPAAARGVVGGDVEVARGGVDVRDGEAGDSGDVLRVHASTVATVHTRVNTQTAMRPTPTASLMRISPTAPSRRPQERRHPVPSERRYVDPASGEVVENPTIRPFTEVHDHPRGGGAPNPAEPQI